MIQYKISPNNIQLKSSFEVKKDDFEQELESIRALHPECLVWNRSLKSLMLEWAVHNAFHALGFVRKQTADTDLNWPQKWYIRLGYYVFGIIVWPFIK